MSEWIDVKERLPEDNKDVLVFTESNNMYVAFLGSYFREFLLANRTSDDAYIEGKVNYWMPLPEEPKD